MNEEEVIEILPCPFCGGGAWIYESTNYGCPAWYITCNVCPAELCGYFSKKKIIKIWNTRVKNS
jgi:hypothetical protein